LITEADCQTHLSHLHSVTSDQINAGKGIESQYYQFSFQTFLISAETYTPVKLGDHYNITTIPN